MTDTILLPTKITEARAYEIFDEICSAKIATIVTETPVIMNKYHRTEKNPDNSKKLNPLFGLVTKRQVNNVIVNADYENMVNNQRAREGNETDFEANERSWGKSVEGKCFIINGSTIYVQAKLNSKKPQSVEYFHNQTGRKVEYSEMQPYLAEKKSNAEHQGVDVEVKIRTFKLANIKEIKINKEHYIVG